MLFKYFWLILLQKLHNRAINKRTYANVIFLLSVELMLLLFRKALLPNQNFDISLLQLKYIQTKRHNQTNFLKVLFRIEFVFAAILQSRSLFLSQIVFKIKDSTFLCLTSNLEAIFLN